MSYPGAKSKAGTFQRIINLIPPHRVFVELFAGSAAIARLKAPAEKTILVDRIDLSRRRDLPKGAALRRGCGIEMAGSRVFPRDWFIYADPPYLPSTRLSRCRYEFDMTEKDHELLLKALVDQKCPVMISGYRSELYDRILSGWNREEFRSMTRGHTWATEVLWFNFPRPAVLHDFSRVGSDYRERWRIKKKKRRWVERLKRQDPQERAALLDALRELGEIPG